MVPAAHKSFTGTEQQGDCEDAEDASTTAPRKEHVGDANDKKIEAMPPPKRKRLASCREKNVKMMKKVDNVQLL